VRDRKGGESIVAIQGQEAAFTGLSVSESYTIKQNSKSKKLKIGGGGCYQAERKRNRNGLWIQRELTPLIMRGKKDRSDSAKMD